MRLLILILFFPYAYSKGKTPAPIEKKALTLQYEVSHYRNKDQISLIFRDHVVELVTNTSSYQKTKEPRLGRFESPMSAELKELKEKLRRYYKHLQQTAPIIFKINPLSLKPEPHSPILRLNEEEMQTSHFYFSALEEIIPSVWDHPWACVDCAFYKKRKKAIERRAVKRILNDSQKKTSEGRANKKNYKAKKKIFSKKDLNCLFKKKGRWECADPEFGLFEI